MAGDDHATGEDLIVNGSFEQPSAGNERLPAGWYYVRQAEWMTKGPSPGGRGREDTEEGRGEGAVDGERYLRFSNKLPGKPAQAQQHLPIDGRTVRAVQVGASIALQDVRPGQSLQELAAVTLRFYDQQDNPLGEETFGPWGGTRAWTREAARIAVPERARLIVVVIGLGGGTGRADFDAISVAPVATNPSALPGRLRP